MSDAVARKLSQFVRKELSRSRPEGERLASFQLRSAGMGKRGNEVDSFDIPPDLTIDNVGMFVDEMLARAQEDADGQGGNRVRYTMVALTEGSKDGPRHAFALTGEGETDDEGDGVEQPNQMGLVSQSMRHTEAFARMAMMGANQQIISLTRQNEALHAQLARMTEQRQKDLEMFEQARTTAHERDMDALRTAGQEDRKAAMFKNLEGLMPLLVNKLSGQKLLPEGPKGDVLKVFIDSLTPEQFQQLAGILGPEQQVTIMSLIQEYRKGDGNPPPNGAVS